MRATSLTSIATIRLTTKTGVEKQSKMMTRPYNCGDGAEEQHDRDDDHDSNTDGTDEPQ